ncbi:MAG: hypothetical protein LBP63_10825 [Prevotellaceae bacterium]|jgi:hypothetical protein|nr:hypothetical protein [Prevotellaceae bacterium]
MDCKNVGGNTGVGTCDLKSQRIDGFIFVPKNAAIPKDTADLAAFLAAKIKLDNKGTRYYPLFGVQQATNNSEEAQSGTLGYGFSVKQRNGNSVMQWDFPFSICKAKTIIQFDGWNQGIYLVSNEGYIIGKNSLDKKDIVPFLPQQFDVVAADLFNLGSTDVQITGVSVNLGDKLKLIEQAQFIKSDDLDGDLLQGLVDVELNLTAQAAGNVDISVITKCGDVNLFDTYQTELAAISLWKLINKTTGAEVVPTSVTADLAKKSFTIAAPAGSYFVSLAAVSVLEEAGIEGYESNQISVTIS